jgi:4-alpha-glucanotransferase
MIEPYYFNYWGERVETPESTRRALLDAMGSDESSFDAGQDGTGQIAPIVVREGQAPDFPAGIDRWSVELESGAEYSEKLEALPLGYHRLHARGTSRALIVTPPRCYLPPRLRGRRTWALSAQLYALRSLRNWGIGDFTDLATFARIAGAAGARAAGINPIHALHPSNPIAASPYSPSSRLFFNVLYIDVERVEELEESPHIQAEIASDGFVNRLQTTRNERLVDYPGVAAAKLRILEQLHEVFLGRHVRSYDARARAFRRFCRAGGTALQRLAIYEALNEHFRSRDPQCYGWQHWPSEYRSPHSRSVEEFVRAHRKRVDFFLYLQWIARRQLAAAARDARDAGAYLYCDLAVGVEHNGADAWADQDALVAHASLGAPPDPLNTFGQNWGLAPFSPQALRRRAYAPLVALLRATMRYAGILRIDHVMALQRAFWIPRGAPASEGAYVRYPLDEMLGIVALESVRNRCAVVGEDLGTVPDGFRERIGAANALSSRLLYFQRDWNDGSFLEPQCWPQLAAASVATHDLPTLAGWWTGDRTASEDRWRDRFLLVDALERAGAADARGAARLRDDAERGGTLAVVGELALGVHRFLAATPSALAVVAIEDILNETEATNVPGTFDERPNWRRTYSIPLELIDDDERFAQTATVMDRR